MVNLEIFAAFVLVTSPVDHEARVMNFVYFWQQLLNLPVKNLLFEKTRYFCE